MDFAWYLAYSNLHKEEKLNAFLQSQGFETFYPVIAANPVNPRAAKYKPFFPRYLFIHLRQQDWGSSRLYSAPGLHHMVSFGDEPARVPQSIIQFLKQRMEWLESSGTYQVTEFSSGDRVRVIRGPFQGYEALFDTQLNGSERVQILLTTLSNPIKMTVNVTDIEKRASTDR